MRSHLTCKHFVKDPPKKDSRTIDYAIVGHCTHTGNYINEWEAEEDGCGEHILRTSVNRKTVGNNA